MTLRRSLTAAAAGVTLIASMPAAAAERSSATASCVTVPATIPGTALVRDGRTAHPRQGALLFVALVEPEKYASGHYPPGFPWQAAVSSNRRVLAALPVCRQSSVSSLPVAVYAFRALEPGKATIVAGLKPRWKAHRRGPARFLATVVVGRA